MTLQSARSSRQPSVPVSPVPAPVAVQEEAASPSFSAPFAVRDLSFSSNTNFSLNFSDSPILISSTADVPVSLPLTSPLVSQQQIRTPPQTQQHADNSKLIITLNIL